MSSEPIFRSQYQFVRMIPFDAQHLLHAYKMWGYFYSLFAFGHWTYSTFHICFSSYLFAFVCNVVVLIKKFVISPLNEKQWRRRRSWKGKNFRFQICSRETIGASLLYLCCCCWKMFLLMSSSRDIAHIF